MVAAVRTPVSGADLALTLLLLALYGAWALPWGWRSGFLPRCWRPSAPGPLLRQAGSLLLMPALGEELLFRVALLPRLDESRSAPVLLAWMALSLGVFVAYHPLSGRLWYPAGRLVFDDGRFLLLCAALGLVCSVAYAASGSLLPPLLLHWLVVLVWLNPLGGISRLGHGEGEA
jgi:predicted Abi (CAAX) family protease